MKKLQTHCTRHLPLLLLLLLSLVTCPVNSLPSVLKVRKKKEEQARRTRSKESCVHRISTRMARSASTFKPKSDQREGEREMIKAASIVISSNHHVTISPLLSCLRSTQVGALFPADQIDQRAVFNYAVNRINSDTNLLLQSVLSPQIETVAGNDSFRAVKSGKLSMRCVERRGDRDISYRGGREEKEEKCERRWSRDEERKRDRPVYQSSLSRRVKVNVCTHWQREKEAEREREREREVNSLYFVFQVYFIKRQ